MNFTLTLKNGMTVKVTATVHEGFVADYSAIAKVEKNGIEREVLVAERGGAFDREIVPAILGLAKCSVTDEDDEDDFAPNWA